MSKYPPCVGCGYCCNKGPCCIAYQYNVVDENEACTLLRHDGTRYVCDFYLKKLGGESSGDMLFIGYGCGSTLFNTVRDEQVERMEHHDTRQVENR